MKFFQNRFVAFLIAAAVVVGSTTVNIGSGLHRACSRLEESFFTVKDGKAPNYYVDQMISAAASLAAVGSHYDGTQEAVSDLREARSELVEAQEERDVSDIAEASSVVLKSAGALSDTLGRLSLSEEDRSTWADAVDTLFGAERKLSSSDYNRDVESFLRNTYSRFPARVFAELLDIDEPELFGDVS